MKLSKVSTIPSGIAVKIDNWIRTWLRFERPVPKQCTAEIKCIEPERTIIVYTKVITQVPIIVEKEQIQRKNA
jgi:hypothetical protein